MPLRNDRDVVRFEFSDQPPKGNRFWMIFQQDSSDVCRIRPGFDEDLVVTTESVALAEWHLGRTEWNQATCRRCPLRHDPGRWTSRHELADLPEVPVGVRKEAADLCAPVLRGCQELCPA